MARARWCRASELDPDRVLDADQVLVGRNNTRRAYNMRMRAAPRASRTALPVAGDKLVCLRNNRKKGLFNGGLWRVKRSAGARNRASSSMRLSPDEDVGGKATKVSVRAECFAGGIEQISTGSSASPTTSSTTAMC